MWYFIDDGPLFDSLPAVVDHYMMFVDGLPTLLKCPVPPPGIRLPSSHSKPVSHCHNIVLALLYSLVVACLQQLYKCVRLLSVFDLKTTCLNDAVTCILLTIANVTTLHISLQSAQSQGQILFGGTRPPPSLPPKPVGLPPPSQRPIPPIPPHSSGGGGAEMAALPPMGEVGPGKPKNMGNYEMVAIKEDCLTLGTELGQGEFGSVLRGKYRPPGGKLVSTHSNMHN